MPSGLKIKALAGMGEQNAYITGAACTQPIDLLRESVKAATALDRAGTRTGTGGDDFIGMGAVSVTGSIEERVRYLASTDPAHVLLKQAFGVARGHWYRIGLIGTALSTYAWIPLRNGAADNVEVAGQFTNAVAASAGISVRLWLKKIGTPVGMTNGVWVEIQTNAAGDPTGTPVADGTSNAILPSAITADPAGAEYEFTFPVGPSLAAATIYHIVLKGDYTASAVNQVQVLTEVLNAGAGGNFEVKDVAWADAVASNLIARGLTTTFTDTFLVGESIEGLYATFAVDKTVAVHELIGLKVQDCTLRSAPATGLTAAYGLIGYDESLAPVNTAAILAGLKNVRSRALHKDLALWVGVQTAALAAANAWPVDSFEASFKRPLDAIVTSGGRQVIEPLENGMREATIKIHLPRYAAETWRTWQNAGTKLQLRAKWTLSTSYITLRAPNCVIDGSVAIETGDAAPYSQDVTLRCFYNPGVNNFTAIQHELELDYLAG